MAISDRLATRSFRIKGDLDLNVRFLFVAPSRDVVVVGAGIIGCAVAYELARRGASVEVIDDRGAGFGATQASAGMLAPFNEAPDGGPLLEIAARGLDVFDDFVARLCLDAGPPLNYRRDGTLDVAFDHARLARLDQTSAILSARGIGAERLDARQVQAREPALSAVRPECIHLTSAQPSQAENVVQATVAGVSYYGDVLQYVVRTRTRDLLVLVPRTNPARFALDDSVWCSWSAEDVYLFSARQASVVMASLPRDAFASCIYPRRHRRSRFCNFACCLWWFRLSRRHRRRRRRCWRLQPCHQQGVRFTRDVHLG